MRCCILSICLIGAMFLIFALHTAESHPVTLDKSERLEIVPINDKETSSSSEETDRNKRMITIAMLRQLFPGLFTDQDKSDSENSLVGAESQRREIKVPFTPHEKDTKAKSNDEDESEDNAAEDEQEEEEEDTDQDASATGEHEKSLDPAHDDLSNLDDGDEDRDKRHGFGFSASADATGGGSAGGSGNFLFDIIRLVSGSGQSEAADEHANGPYGVGVSAEAHSDEPIPGPVTRLFVVANRSVANLVQDLILRLAQTSERFVNFKARLITSLI